MNRPARTCGETGPGFRQMNNERTMRSVAISAAYTSPVFAHKIGHTLVPQGISIALAIRSFDLLVCAFHNLSSTLYVCRVGSKDFIAKAIANPSPGRDLLIAQILIAPEGRNVCRNAETPRT